MSLRRLEEAKPIMENLSVRVPAGTKDKIRRRHPDTPDAVSLFVRRAIEYYFYYEDYYAQQEANAALSSPGGAEEGSGGASEPVELNA